MENPKSDLAEEARRWEEGKIPTEGWVHAPEKIVAPKCAEGRARHCIHPTTRLHKLEVQESSHHECLICCWCGWTVCRSATFPAGTHGPFLK